MRFIDLGRGWLEHYDGGMVKRGAQMPLPREKFTGKEDELLADEARRILRAEMLRRGFSFKELAAAMQSGDTDSTESVQALINKVNRGRFSFAFFLRAARAMGMSSVDISPVHD